MKLIQIQQFEDGGHRYQTIDHIRSIPDGWAVIPDAMETPNLPYGDIIVEEIEGVPTVTSWTPREIPEPEPVEPEPVEPSVEERVEALETETAELSEALNMILEGVTE